MLLLLAGLLSMALLTYAPADPGWNSVGYSGAVSNATGRAGAWFADFLFSLFGVFAWMIPVVLFGKVALVVRYRYESWEWGISLMLMRLFGFVIALSSGAALAELYAPGLSALPTSTGGIIGQIILQQFLPVFNCRGQQSVVAICVYYRSDTVHRHFVVQGDRPDGAAGLLAAFRGVLCSEDRGCEWIPILSGQAGSQARSYCEKKG